MYHGTPNAGFTKFKSGTYFTQHKWYADRYQSQGASSLGYKKTADNPDTYTVYLNIKKPFDTRNKTERDIFYKEYYRQWGTGTNLMESGLPDWLDGIDLQEFLEEKGYDYDGLILDEGGTGGYGDEVVSRGISYMIFDSSEVKNVDNTKPTSDPDIRYSLSEIVAEDGTSYGIGVKLDSTLLDNLDPKDRVSLIKEYVRELQGKVFTAFDEDGEPVDISIAEGNKRFRNSKGNRVATNKDLTTKHISKETKQEAIALIDELVSTATYQGSEAARHPHDWLDNDGNNDWDKWTTYIQDKNNTIWEATLHIANTTNGEKILYDISLIKKAEQSGKSDTSLLTLGQSGESDTIPDVNIIAPLTENVKRDAKFSLSDTEDIAPVDNIVDNVDIAPIANKYSDIDGLYTCIRNLKNY